eukprot:2805056-Alexandrium_andersonii.AAC.1
MRGRWGAWVAGGRCWAQLGVGRPLLWAGGGKLWQEEPKGCRLPGHPGCKAQGEGVGMRGRWGAWVAGG